MISLLSSSNMKDFEKCISQISGKKVIPICISVYSCWKLFHTKYSDVPSWKKAPTIQLEWISELKILEAEFLEHENNGYLPSGFATGVRMTILFYKSISMHESSLSINRMSDYLDRLKKIGCEAVVTSPGDDVGLVRGVYMKAPKMVFSRVPGVVNRTCH
jgi:hypothetical protein